MLHFHLLLRNINSSHSISSTVRFETKRSCTNECGLFAYVGKRPMEAIVLNNFKYHDTQWSRCKVMRRQFWGVRIEVKY